MKHPHRIIAIHLLNDLSGSPFVFSQALKALQQEQMPVHLFTSMPGTPGFLSHLPGIQYHPHPYRRHGHPWITLFLFLTCQCLLLIRLLFFLQKTDTVYINSMMPFGAALAGRLRGCRIVFHIHEISIRPPALKNFLLQVIEHTADQCIYVSQYVQQHTPINTPGIVVYNSLPQAFIEQAETEACEGIFTVLMLCSLRKYKGIEAFTTLARLSPSLNFELVLNADAQEIARYFSDQPLPVNLQLFTARQHVHPFYKRASVVVNLSYTDSWIETFGMTILEAMYYGKPVVIPPVGGITELVQDGKNGFIEDSRNTAAIARLLRILANDRQLYAAMASASRSMASRFTPDHFHQALVPLFRKPVAVGQHHASFQLNNKGL